QAGWLFSQDGQIDNRRQLMRALERACTHLGVAFEEGCSATGLVTGSAGQLQAVELLDAAGERRRLGCDQAVLACGAWSAQLLPQLPVVPIKGQMLSLQGPQQALQHVLFGPGTYLVPREDGLIVVGATSEPEAGFADGLTPFGQRQLQVGISGLLPAAAQWPPMERWWGYRPGTPDEGPLLGASPIPGLWLATGHYRNGVLLAAITADLLAGAIAAEPLEAEQQALLQAFDWRRFGWTEPFSGETPPPHRSL
ncbi:MAG: FAD-dependent oxidoreductase, partial [Cyanobacteria bacterium K_DeepCast_35m_m2_023]|nr:FAD-dependent oxidoreductase [Cyanobacteria bacterium K_DeepCast_35m_m2_023]